MAFIGVRLFLKYKQNKFVYQLHNMPEQAEWPRHIQGALN
jgi:hypothetical protein